MPSCQLKDKHSIGPVVHTAVMPAVEDELRGQVLRGAAHGEALGVQLCLAIHLHCEGDLLRKA